MVTVNRGSRRVGAHEQARLSGDRPKPATRRYGMPTDDRRLGETGRPSRLESGWNSDL
jgi:hypothetical protein